LSCGFSISKNKKHHKRLLKNQKYSDMRKPVWKWKSPYGNFFISKSLMLILATVFVHQVH
jgi:hypothetical protein